jgi:hypothetical protein
MPAFGLFARTALLLTLRLLALVLDPFRLCARIGARLYVSFQRLIPDTSGVGADE